MNKKRLFVGGGVILALICIFAFIYINIGGNKKDDESSTSGNKSTEITTKLEDDTKDDTEGETKDNNIKDDQTTNNGTTADDYEPTEYQLACRAVLKNQIFEVGYEKYEEGYLHMLYVYENAYRDAECKFTLINIDGDDVPEMVAEINGSITMYTFKDGYVYKLIDENEVISSEYFQKVPTETIENLAGETGMREFIREMEKPELVRISDEKCREAYLKIIEQFETDTEEDMSRSYSLIDFDGDAILELVCQRGGHRITVYTYEDGQVYQLTDDWSWGGGANHGYEYIPGKNVMRNRDSNTGEYLISYDKINENNELELMYYLVKEWGDEEDEKDNRYYKYVTDNEEEITETEYNEMMIEGFYYMIEGCYSREEIEEYLK